MFNCYLLLLFVFTFFLYNKKESEEIKNAHFCILEKIKTFFNKEAVLFIIDDAIYFTCMQFIIIIIYKNINCIYLFICLFVYLFIIL